MMTYGRGEVSAGLPRTVPLPRVADRPGANRGGYGASGELRRAPALLRIACPRVTAGPATGTCSDARPTGPSWLQSADKSR